MGDSLINLISESIEKKEILEEKLAKKSQNQKIIPLGGKTKAKEEAKEGIAVIKKKEERRNNKVGIRYGGQVADLNSSLGTRHLIRKPITINH